MAGIGTRLAQEVVAAGYYGARGLAMAGRAVWPHAVGFGQYLGQMTGRVVVGLGLRGIGLGSWLWNWGRGSILQDRLRAMTGLSPSVWEGLSAIDHEIERLSQRVGSESVDELRRRLHDRIHEQLDQGTIRLGTPQANARYQELNEFIARVEQRQAVLQEAIERLQATREVLNDVARHGAAQASEAYSHPAAQELAAQWHERWSALQGAAAARPGGRLARRLPLLRAESDWLGRVKRVQLAPWLQWGLGAAIVGRQVGAAYLNARYPAAVAIPERTRNLSRYMGRTGRFQVNANGALEDEYGAGADLALAHYRVNVAARRAR